MPTYLDILTRAILAYFTLFALTRLMGKREISQMTFFDYIVGITIGTLTGALITDTNKNFTTILPALIVFTLFQIITAYLSLKNRTFRKIFDGSKTILVKNGKILEKNMLKSRLNIDELNTRLRQKNVFKLADVEFAYLEPDGKISVMKKSNKAPITPSDINLQVKSSGIGHLVIEEGEIIENVLRQNKLTKAWLMNKLSQQGINNISDVMFGQVDDSGNLYVDRYEDTIK